MLSHTQSPLITAIANVTPLAEIAQNNAFTRMVEVIHNIPKFVVPDLNPLASMIRTAQEVVQQSVAPIIQLSQSVRTIVDQYQELMKNIRATYEHFLNLIHTNAFSWLSEVAKRIQQTFVMPWYLWRYHILQRARDGDHDSLLLVSRIFSFEHSRFCRLQKYQKSDVTAKLEFASYVIEAMGGSVNTESENGNLLDRLPAFFTRLFYALRDMLRKMAHKLQQTLSNDRTPFECTIEHAGIQYLLLPSLSIFTGVPESTLRRYAARGDIPAIKLPYRSTKTGNVNKTWHVEYSAIIIESIKALAHHNRQRTAQNRLTRKQIVQFLNIHLDTLRLWERKGLVTPKHVHGRVWYLPEHLLTLKQIIENNHRLQPALLPSLHFS